ncbi:hypothetical protein [Streptomyces sp. NPDC017529]|uniref:hypothetical protein n=1 Tax=Streptomyces sp. NPDC017529 TaxID=3365000 RepID=UPI0037913A61
MPVPAVAPGTRQAPLDAADTGVFPVYGLDEVLTAPQRYALLRVCPDTPSTARSRCTACPYPGW